MGSRPPASYCGRRRAPSMANEFVGKPTPRPHSHAGQTSINCEVVARDAFDGESTFETRAHAATIEVGDATRGSDRLIDSIDKEPRNAVVDDLWRRTATESNHRRAAGHRFNHHDPEGLRPVDGKKHGRGAAQECALLALVDFADVLDIGICVDQRLDPLFPIGPVSPINLGGHLQFRPNARRNFDRQIRPFFRRNASEEREISARRLGTERKQVARQAVVDHSCPIDRRHRLALIMRYRDQGRAGEDRIKTTRLGHIEAAVKRRHRAVDELPDQRIVQHIHMKVEDVKIVSQLAHGIEHHDVVGQRILHLWIEPKGDLAK